MIANSARIKQQRERRRLLGVGVFVVLVLLSGLVLKLTHNIDDPFGNMSDIIDMRQMLTQTQEEKLPDEGLPQVGPVDDALGESQALPLSESAKHGLTITWSAGGEVLYDIWFIGATTAVAMVCGYVLRWLGRVFNHLLGRPAQAKK